MKKKEQSQLDRKYHVRDIVLVIGILLLCVFLAVSYFFSIVGDLQNEAIDFISKQVWQENRYMTREIEQTLQVISNAADEIAEDASFADNREQLYEKLEMVQQTNDFFRVSFVDAGGTLRLPSGETLSIYGEKGFSACQEGQSYVSDILTDQLTGFEIVTFSTPILKSGKFVGAIAGAVLASELQQRVMDQTGNGNGYTYIVDDAGEILFYSPTTPYSGTHTNYFSNMKNLVEDSAPVMAKIQRDIARDVTDTVYLKGRYQMNDSMVDGYVGYCAVEAKSGWNIIYYVPMDETTVFSQRVAFKSAGAALGIILLFIGMLFVLVRVENKKNRKMQDLLYQDLLTGIANSAFFEKRAEAILKETPEKPYAILRFDINNFKFLNDTYGYGTGDTLLKVFAKALNENYTEGELAARMTSDHFVLLSNHKGGQIARLRGVLSHSLTGQFSVELVNALNCSYGLYELKDAAETVKSAIDKANIALKEAKTRTGRYAAVYNDQLLKRIDEEASLTMRMKNALANNEFKVYLQPKFRISTMEYMGAEALIRWLSPELGFLPPDRFIPLFEKNGFISEIDFFVLECVCKRCVRLRDMGVPFYPISVNWSRVTLMQPNYLTRLKAVLEKYDMPAQTIEMEVTESSFTKNYNYIIKILKEMKNMGLAIVMDDFGSDYSSLKLLKNLPIDVLKIDKGFLDESFTTDRTYHIIRCVIEMGKALHIQVVCEGVETKEHVEMLRKLGCDVGQGYIFSKPVPMEEFDRLTHGVSPERPAE